MVTQKENQQLMDQLIEVVSKHTAKTCVECLYFDEPSETCQFNQSNMRPPARIIAFGCDVFEYDIPF
jgi:hypothetical protein